MIPTIDSMKMIGVPASVSATKITPRATSSDAPACEQAEDRQPDRAADRRRARERRQAQAQRPAPVGREARGARGHRGQVVQADEVVADRHRDDRVEPGHLQRGRSAPAEDAAARGGELGRAVARVGQQHRDADPREGAHRAPPPGAAGVGHEGDHRHGAALDRQRHPEPDRPEEGEARELLGAEERVAEDGAGEDVGGRGAHRDADGNDGADPGDPDRRLRVDLQPARAEAQAGDDAVLGRGGGGGGVAGGRGHGDA